MELKLSARRSREYKITLVEILRAADTRLFSVVTEVSFRSNAACETIAQCVQNDT